MTEKPGARTPQQETRESAEILWNCSPFADRWPIESEVYEAFEYAYERGRLEGIEEAAKYMDRCAERWVESLPFDQVASINCRQAAKGIRSLGRKG